MRLGQAVNAMLVVGGLLASAGTAAAHETRFYLGGALGQSTFEDWDDIDEALDDGSFTSSSTDDSDSGFRLFWGASPSPHVAFELGYNDLGTATMKAQSDGCCFYPAGPVKVALNPTGFDGSLVLRAPISDSFAVGLRGGLLNWDADVDVSVSGGSGSESESGTDFFYGLLLEAGGRGLLKFRGEYAHYKFDDLDGELDSISGSILFQFGGPRRR